MKIIQINSVYNSGSTGKIVYDCHKYYLSQGVDSLVCFGRGQETQDKGVFKVCTELYSKLNNLYSRLSGIMYGGLMFSTKRLISIIAKEKPDVVHLHCINGYFINIYKLVTYLNNNKIPTVLTLHAEFMYTGNCGHAFECEKWKTGCGKCANFRQITKSLFIDNTSRSWAMMKRSFDGFGDNLIVTSVSPWLYERASNSPILNQFKHKVVLNGIDTSVFKLRTPSTIRYEKRENEKIVFFVTPEFSIDPQHIKGGKYVFELAKELKDITFLIAGPYDTSIVFPRNVVMLGMVNDKETLSEYYNIADVTLLTSKRETFSMVCAESLCCGTPVIGFKAGAPEKISLPEYSKWVDYGNLDALKKTLVSALDQVVEKQKISDKAKLVYDRNIMADNYLSVYNELLS